MAGEDEFAVTGAAGSHLRLAQVGREWTGVLGGSEDFSRNCSYTALSRAREPVEIFLVDEQSALWEEREEIAPAEQCDAEREPLERMAARMRERDDEDLALEQLEHDARQPDQLAEPGVSPIRPRLYELEEQQEAIHGQLQDPAIEDAGAISRLQDTIGAIEREHERDRRPHGWRDRAGHQTRRRQRERELDELHEHQNRLLARVPDPRAVLERAEDLREQHRALRKEHRALREEAIREELASRPPWLEATLGPEPPDHDLRERRQKTAREIAGHRIDLHISDPSIAVSDRVRDHALRRALADARAALGLEVRGREHGSGFER